jgi:2-amino-4-hydroxy-6-hydroxymethyldihydropteridine diphosphokinase
MLRACALLDGTPGCTVVARSALYETEAIGEAGEGLGDRQPRYANAAVRVRTTLEPHELLACLLAIERRLGRERAHEGGRCRPREIDLDLLWIEGITRADETLTVPHPRLAQRSFALAPLLDVAPELEATYGAALARAGGRPARLEWPAPGHDLYGC